MGTAELPHLRELPDDYIHISDNCHDLGKKRTTGTVPDCPTYSSILTNKVCTK